jgi:hypothetical protein
MELPRRPLCWDGYVVYIVYLLVGLVPLLSVARLWQIDTYLELSNDSKKIVYYLSALG